MAITPGAPLFLGATDIESEAGGDAIVATLSAAGSTNIGYVFMDGALV